MTLAGKQGGEEGSGLESAPCVPGTMLGLYFPRHPCGAGVAFLCFQMGKLAERLRGIPQHLRVLKYCPGMGMQVLKYCPGMGVQVLKYCPGMGCRSWLGCMPGITSPGSPGLAPLPGISSLRPAGQRLRVLAPPPCPAPGALERCPQRWLRPVPRIGRSESVN